MLITPLQKQISFEGILVPKNSLEKDQPKWFKWPPISGTNLPITIDVPPATISKSQLMELANSLGLRVAKNLSRANIRDRIIAAMELCGYIYEKDQLKTARPIQLVQVPPKLVEILPVWIDANSLTSATNLKFLCDQYPKIFEIFRRKRNPTAQHLISSLIQMGYQQDNEGNFIRFEPLMGSPEGPVPYFSLFDFPDLVNYLKSSEEILLSPKDLHLINSQEFEKFLHKSWNSIDEFISTVTANFLAINQSISESALRLFLALASLEKKLSKNTQLLFKNLEISDEKEIWAFLRSRLQLQPELFVHRTPEKGPTSPSISLRKAIQDGYTFQFSDYRPELSILLGDNWVPVNYQKAMVKILAEYPDLYFKFLDHRISQKDPIQKIIRLMYPYPPNRFQYLYAFAVGYPFLLEESPEQIQRRTDLYSLPENYQEALFDIYQTGRNLEEILDQPVSALEKYLLVIRKSPNSILKSLVQGFGMFVPENLSSTEIRDYVLLFMSDYREIPERPANYPRINSDSTFTDLRDFLEQARFMTDFEIIAELGYPGAFENRGVLCTKLYEINTNGGFLLWPQYSTTRTLNLTTTLLTPLNEVLPPYLAFGTSYEYRVYECDELNHAFKPNEEGFVVFNNFENPPEPYTEEQINQLIMLLPTIKALNSQLISVVDQICHSVQIGIQSNRFLSNQGQKFMRDLSKQIAEIKELVRQILLNIFYAGMYMRRWQGPGNEYPVLAQETHSNEDPMPRTSLALVEVNNLMLKLENTKPDLAESLKNLSQVVLPPSGSLIAYTGTPLFDLLDRIGTGNMCIRLASRPLIGSAYHYLAVLFNFLVPGFNPDNLQAIA